MFDHFGDGQSFLRVQNQYALDKVLGCIGYVIVLLLCDIYWKVVLAALDLFVGGFDLGCFEGRSAEQ